MILCQLHSFPVCGEVDVGRASTDPVEPTRGRPVSGPARSCQAFVSPGNLANRFLSPVSRHMLPLEVAL